MARSIIQVDEARLGSIGCKLRQEMEGECWGELELENRAMIDVSVQEATLLLKCCVCLQELGGFDVFYHRTVASLTLHPLLLHPCDAAEK